MKCPYCKRKNGFDVYRKSFVMVGVELKKNAFGQQYLDDDHLIKSLHVGFFTRCCDREIRESTAMSLLDKANKE